MTILYFILLIGVLIFVHELGHFLAAKRYGIGVPVFSLGFGPRLFGFKRGGTDYRVALIPLGGYVRMAGDEADENRSGAPDEFLSRSRWQRFVVFVAGATFNIVLAVVVVALLFRVWGKEEPPAAEVPPTVVEVMAGSTAAEAGVEPGDQVIAVSGRDMRDPRTEAEEILLQPDTEKTVVLERDGRRIEVAMSTGSDPRYHLGFPGWLLRSDSPGTPGISYVASGSPAQKAGLQRGDKILGIDQVMDPGEVRLRAMVAASPGQEIVLHVERGGQRLDIPLVPRDESGVGRIGVVFRTSGPVRNMGLGEAFVESLRFNGETARALFLALRSIGTRLFRGEIGAVRAFSGPIEIAEMSRRSLEDPQAFLQFLAILSLNLGIFNLLPIPVLDGGHILILLVEGVLRKDLSQKIKERVLQAGFVFLILLFGAVMFFDVVKRYFPS
jgi:regulator of sigma E protease